MIDREPNRDGLALDSRQGDVGKEAALVAPAHVCVGAAKPTLLNILARLNERRPERHLIVRPELVDGYGVGGILDDPAQFHIMKRILLRIKPLQRVQRDSEGSYRIPHAEKLDFDFTRIAVTKILRLVGVSALVALTIKRIGVPNAICILG